MCWLVLIMFIIYIYICITVINNLLVCLFACLLVCLFACLFVCLFVCLSVCLFVCLFVCSSWFEAHIWLYNFQDHPLHLFRLRCFITSQWLMINGSFVNLHFPRLLYKTDEPDLKPITIHGPKICTSLCCYFIKPNFNGIKCQPQDVRRSSSKSRMSF